MQLVGDELVILRRDCVEGIKMPVLGVITL